MAIIGFRFIRRVAGQQNAYYNALAGQVDYQPVRNYKTEKKNAFNPSIIHRRGEYREDTLKLSVVCTPSQYHDLVAFITVAGSYYIEYDSPIGTLRQYPIEFNKLPECPDDLHEYASKVEFSAVSRYIGTPGYIDFSIFTLCPDDEIQA